MAEENVIKKKLPTMITRITNVTIKNGKRTERELTPEEIEEWKKEHMKPINKGENS